MHFVALVSWWYGSGWLDQIGLIRERFSRVADRYSLSLLLRTFFSPFKQLDAYGGGDGLNARLKAWLDRLISRMIGAMIRSFMMVVGLIAIAIEALIAVLRLFVWPLIPLTPLIGLILVLIGWLPWR